jgi:hypothetical protein
MILNSIDSAAAKPLTGVVARRLYSPDSSIERFKRVGGRGQIAA